MAERRHWIQADLRCLLCGRNVGRLVGPAPADRAVRLEVKDGLHPFRVFRPADPADPPVRLAGRERFHCHVCGGLAVMEEVERFATFEAVVVDEPEKRRCGRPPKPWRPVTDSRLDGLGLAS
jgi:hypothetical protein